MLLWGLGGAALVGIVATAYMMGRLAAGPAAPRSSPAEPAGEAAWPGTTSVPAGRSALEGPPPSPIASAVAPPIDAAPGATQATPASDAGGTRREVAAYFASLDALNVERSLGGDPQALAQKILMRVQGGDMSAIDELVETQRSAVQALRAISAPPPCAEHHRRTLALMEKAAGLTSQLREAFGGNMDGLIALEGVAREAERESQELKTLDRGLRRSYGLPAPPD